MMAMKSSTSTPPPIDLKHMTSNGALTSPVKPHRSANRLSQHLDLRVGSPTSIPSSPTSIRSSTSAIFERDIEPIVSPLPTSAHHPPNPHRVPRAKGTEQLEHSVPSVLDSAAAILADIDPTDDTTSLATDVAVLSPANSFFDSMVGRSSGFASPIGSFRSRSPSPSRTGGTTGRDILLAIPGSPPVPSNSASPTSLLGLTNVAAPPPSLLALSPPSQSSSPPLKPTIQTVAIPLPGSISKSMSSGTNKSDISQISNATPSIVTPTSAYFSSASSAVESGQSSPTTTTVEHPPNNVINAHTLSPLSHSTTASNSSGSPLSSSPPINTNIHPMASPVASQSMASPSTSHPPSPLHVPKKRLSFMSYSDLLTSTPAATQTLSSLTTCASSTEPPPHIPSVSGLGIASAIHAAQHGGSNASRGGSRAPSIRQMSLGSVGASPFGGIVHPNAKENIALLGSMSGEWEREGMGMGLDERLEGLVINAPASRPVVGGKA
ncbi:hypothetical protein CPB83DRAFT_864890 [Crepidotus variabilis]|uniref:Uncharacterized protein n=1 Tax=Crepidotus variabilis TaxID=179855 RepID=A0A9P6E473_9AGAR|nr:hypothetical protein CPB83DRAFT_864890 [Crepidotus variabilis]